MIKKILILLPLLAASAFALDWGIYGGPGFNMSMTNMTPVYDELQSSPVFTGYDAPRFANIQMGLATPITIRLGNFAIGLGDAMAWQTSKGTNWKTSFYHTVNSTSFGYIIDLGEHLRLTPAVGIGNYDIRMNISNITGGFGDTTTNGISVTYDYSNFSINAGASFAYFWKFENRIIVGLEAKARYIVPLEQNAEWRPDDHSYGNNTVEGFYPATPVIGLNFLIGYEKVGEKPVIDEEWEEDN